MKVWFSIFLLLFFFSASVYAERAMPPELLLPLDVTKNSAKQAIKFSWQKATNAVPAKVYAYRLLISETSRFNGYSASASSCNTSCIFAEVDSATFNYSTDLRLSNKVYYWKVQAVGAENGLWSTTRTIQTKKDIVIPTISTVSALPNPVIQNNALTFSTTLSNELPKDFSVKLDYGNGLVAMSGSGKNYSVSKSLSKQGVQTFSVGIYDSKNTLQGKTASGQFEVIAPPPPDNTAPILKKLSAANSSVLGENYEIQLEVSDVDNNLSSVLIDWGDGSSNPQPVSNGYASFSLSHSYDTAGTFTWSAVASDKKDAQSEMLTQKVTISKAVAKMPSISAISATPASVVTGNSLTFSATLSAKLPSGYSVKVDYGNGLIALSGSGTRYSVSKTPIKLGQQLFSIGIYDSKSVLQSNSAMTGNFEITNAAPVNVAPALSFISGNSSATTNAAYSVQLQATDADNNLSLIFMDWGDGTSESKNATSGATVSFSHNYATANSFSWNATAYDSLDATSLTVSKTVTVSKPADVTVTKTTGYSKIANNGSTLADSAKLGANATDWACTKDNKTGLIWEVKTTDGGLRDMNNYYTNYTPDYPGGSGSKYGDSTNTDGFVSAVNNQSLCGADDWRLPTNEELKGLVVCSDGKYNTLAEGDYGFICKSNEGWNLTTTSPTINATYFPNTQSDWFWSSSPYANYSNYAWSVFFDYGYSGGNDKGNGSNVRLVRG
ncbi:MAG: DUF1566 domain-containing protein [Methylococcaceae bacterium]